MHRTFMLIYCLNIRVFCWKIVLVWDSVLVCSLCSDAHRGIQVEHAQSVYCLSSHFSEEQAAVPCSQELWPEFELLQDTWNVDGRRTNETPIPRGTCLLLWVCTASDYTSLFQHPVTNVTLQERKENTSPHIRRKTNPHTSLEARLAR